LRDEVGGGFGSRHYSFQMGVQVDTYYIYSIKMNAWWGTVGAYTSDLKSAKEFTRAEALAFAKKRHDKVSGLQVIPVSKLDIVESMI